MLLKQLQFRNNSVYRIFIHFRKNKPFFFLNLSTMHQNDTLTHCQCLENGRGYVQMVLFQNYHIDHSLFEHPRIIVCLSLW
jgi:hypothetical protein